MKKRILPLMMTAVLAAGFVACGNNATEEQPATSQTQTEENTNTEEPEETTSELSADDKAAAFQAYLDSQKKLDGKTFKLSGGYDPNEGIYPVVEAEDGLLYWEYVGSDVLVTVDYMSGNNNLNINSWTVGASGEVELTSSVNLEEFISFNDDINIDFSSLSLTDKDNVMMIESRGMAYTYADGVDYHITLIEIKNDGVLDKFYEDNLAGSGDEDITADIRASFNKATGQEYSKDTFEDAFYNGNLLTEQENRPVLANISFKSDSGKLADNNDWDGASAIASKLYENMDKPVDPIYWGEGKFKAESYK